jgi:hypothetical protein
MHGEDLFQLVYVSRSRGSLSDDDLRAIQSEAVKRNGPLGVTGVLLYSGGCFLQLLEGPRKAISEVYGKISTDPRHHRPSVLYFEPAETRLAQAWSMGVLNMDHLRAPVAIEDLLNRFRDEAAAVEGGSSPVEGLVFAFERMTQERDAA